MAFKIGDNVQIINPDSIAYQLPGIVTSVHLFQGTYEVAFSKGQLWFNASELELIPILPVGTQSLLDTNELSKNETETNSIECDCGGFRVYGIIPAEAHSPWCSIFEK